MGGSAYVQRFISEINLHCTQRIRGLSKEDLSIVINQVTPSLSSGVLITPSLTYKKSPLIHQMLSRSQVRAAREEQLRQLEVSGPLRN